MPSYTSDYYAEFDRQVRTSAGVIVPMILDITRAASVVDVGCGPGIWLSVFRERGVEAVLGIDGDYVTPDMLKIPPERFSAADLATAFDAPRRFDLVLSLEVAEHLPEQSADVFIASLVGLGPVVLFSAAVPHQGGVEHVNEQWPRYWAEKFRTHGYQAFDPLRLTLWHDDRVAWWYAQNLILYVDRSHIDRLPALASPVEHPASLVHPHRYVEWVEWGIRQSEKHVATDT